MRRREEGARVLGSVMYLGFQKKIFAEAARSPSTLMPQQRSAWQRIQTRHCRIANIIAKLLTASHLAPDHVIRRSLSKDGDRLHRQKRQARGTHRYEAVPSTLLQSRSISHSDQRKAQRSVLTEPEGLQKFPADPKANRSGHSCSFQLAKTLPQTNLHW
jgi:hypothetical protein